MASIRRFKSDVEYLVNEVISDCYTCLIINNDVDKDKVFGVMNGAVQLRNDLIEKINNPKEPKNKKLNKKYYAQLHSEMITSVDQLFSNLSGCLAK